MIFSPQVRRLNSSDTFWYDENVLRPLSDVEARSAQAAVAFRATIARSVPVLDCTAAPGMLVRRVYGEGTLRQGTWKEAQVGVLICRVSGAGAGSPGWHCTITYRT